MPKVYTTREIAVFDSDKAQSRAVTHDYLPVAGRMVTVVSKCANIAQYSGPPIITFVGLSHREW